MRAARPRHDARRADAHRQPLARRGRGRVHDSERFDLHLDAPRRGFDVAAVGFVQHDREFLAAVARSDVQRPARAAVQAPRDLAQAFVAGLVPVVIVVGLEVVDIDQQQAERRRCRALPAARCGRRARRTAGGCECPSGRRGSRSRSAAALRGSWCASRAPACSRPSRRSRW